MRGHTDDFLLVHGKRLASDDLNVPVNHLSRRMDRRHGRDRPGSKRSVNETNSLLYCGAAAFDPVTYGVAQGLSEMFPPVEHPAGLVGDEATPQDAEGSDAAS